MDRNLIDYLPQVLKEIRELKLIFQTEQTEVESSWGAIDNGFNDQFISDATENGVSRWEKILGIVPQATRTVDERKFLILTRLSEQLPFTLTTLKNQLDSLCGEDGYSVVVSNDTYTITIRVALTAKNNFNDVNVLLQRFIPANMVVDLSLLYNQHLILMTFTHAQLSPYTHDQLRNEVVS